VNYYRRYVGDYLRDTSRLSILEHGAYNLLLDYYYAEDGPISLDLEEVYRMVRAQLPEERRAVVKVLTTYFVKMDDGYHNSRADQEIQIAKETIEAQRNSGKEAADKRWSTHRSTHGSTNKSTDGSTHESTNGSTGGSTGRSAIQPPTPNLQPPTASLQEKPKDTVGQKPDLKPLAVEVLNFLNSKTGRSYRPVNGTLGPILARLREGARVEDMRAVIAKKCRDWAGNPKMNEYLRPKTLFRPENYANYEGELLTVEAE
jgi:uncharacterized phage protein (TIGR02220 family)